MKSGAVDAVSTVSSSNPTLWANLIVVALAIVYMVASAGLIHFNKWLMEADRFPYSVCMALLHMAMSSTCCIALLAARPSLFPALTDRESLLQVDRKLLLTGVLPIAMFFVCSVCLSNTAYLYASVAFLQMMKEANVVIIYFLSLMAALERFSWQNFGVLFVIVFATSLTVQGEVHFAMMGFVIQLSAMGFECSRIILQTLLLSPQGRKLDPMSYCALVTPVCFCVLAFSLVVLSRLAPNVGVVQVPPLHVFAQMWPYLLANSAHAFILNVLTAVFLKNASAVAFILTGIVKDAFIVLSGCLFLHERICAQQALGFGLQLTLIAGWSLSRAMAAPQPAAAPCCLAKPVDGERQPLLVGKGSEDGDVDESSEVASQGSRSTDEPLSAGRRSPTILASSSSEPYIAEDLSDTSSEGARARKGAPHAEEVV